MPQFKLAAADASRNTYKKIPNKKRPLELHILFCAWIDKKIDWVGWDEGAILGTTDHASCILHHPRAVRLLLHNSTRHSHFYQTAQLFVIISHHFLYWWHLTRLSQRAQLHLVCKGYLFWWILNETNMDGGNEPELIKDDNWRQFTTCANNLDKWHSEFFLLHGKCSLTVMSH